MALARQLIASGKFPLADCFAFSPTLNPTVHHEWGFGLIAYMITANPLGDLLLMSLRFLLAVGILLCCYRVCRSRGGDPLLFALGLILVLPFFWVGFSTLRAQQFTLAFLALQLVMLESDWRHQKAWILIWLVMLVLWLNIHAGFVVGAAMIILHGCERCLMSWTHQKSLATIWKTTWHLWIAAPLAILALWMNPYGSQYISYLMHGLTMPRPDIGEWWPLWTIMNPWQTLFCFALAVGLIGYTVRYRRWSRLRGSVFLLLCALMAFKHTRHASIFALVWLAYVPAWLTYTPLGRRLRSNILAHPQTAYRFAGCLAAVSVGFFLWFQGYKTIMPVNEAGKRGNYPLGAIAYLERNQIRGRFITDFDSGAYVTWRLYPNVMVSLDGRYEAAFQPGVLEKHLDFFYAKTNAAMILDQWRADGIILPSGTPLSKQLLDNLDKQTEVQLSGSSRYWKCVYRDPGTSVWIDTTRAAPVEINSALPSNGRYP